MGLTSEQFRRRHDLNKEAIEGLLCEVLGWNRRQARDGNRPLNAYELDQLQRALPSANPNASAPEPPSDPPAPAAPSPRLHFLMDQRAAQRPLRRARFNLYAHEDFLEAADEPGRAHLKRRVALVLHHLAAHGRTSVNKPTHGENLGWLRAPLGGNKGSHFYLWWTRRGTPALKGHALDQPHNILLRSIRHHDDHRPLKVGEEESYLKLDVPELEDETLISPPWAQPQLEFIQASDPVRVLAGYPGSGKTTALWKAVDARRGESVLYVTWSAKLTLRADEHFETFAAADTTVEALAFTDLLGRLLGEDIPRLPLAAGRAAFASALKRISPDLMGPWRGRADALFAEIRGGLVGAARRTSSHELADPERPRLKDTIYRTRRAKLGEAALDALLVIAGLLEGDGDPLSRFFPELEAAWRAAALLMSERPLPVGFEYSRMVVDEVQDLTLLEATVITELARRLAARQGRAPFLLLAGDEGQTVRPSHFQWGALNRLLDARLTAPRKYTLEGNLRSPRAIAEVIDRTGELYDFLPKDKRPRHRIAPDAHFAASAQLFYVRAKAPSQAQDFLAAFEELGGGAILRLDDAPPAWLKRADLLEALLLPEEAKGLEHQTVCVLDPGAHLLRLLALDPTDVDVAIKREAIDRLRVAVSRATETLIFLDVKPTAAARAESLRLLGRPVEYDGPDLIAHLKSAHITPEERVTRYLQDALQMQEERPVQAWRRARQAVRLLGDPELPNGVADDALRREALEVSVRVAWWLYCDASDPVGLDAAALRRDSLAAARALDAPRWVEALERLADEHEARDVERLFPLLEALREIPKPPTWMRHALRRRAQGWRKRLSRASEDPQHAARFSGDVERWLQLLDVPTAALADEAYALREAALRRLLREGAPVDAALTELHRRLDGRAPALTAAFNEARGDYAEAGRLFERLGDSAGALRCGRAEGNLDRTLAHLHAAPPRVESALRWLSEIRASAGRRPADLDELLTPAEREALLRLIARLGPS